MADHAVSPPEVALPAPSEHSRQQLEALLEVSEAIAQQRDLPALFHDLAERLHRVIEFDFLTLVLHNAKTNGMRLHILEAQEIHEDVTGAEYSIEATPSGLVWETQQPFVLADTADDGGYPEFFTRLREYGVRSLVILPLTTAQRRLGAMGFGRFVPHQIPDDQLQFMQRVASQVAVAVDNGLNFETAQKYQKQLARERDRLRVLLEINNILVSSRGLPDLFRGIVTAIERLIQLDYTSLALQEPVSGLLKIYALNFPGGQHLIKPEMAVPRDSSPAGRAIATGETVIARGAEFDRYSSEVLAILRREG